MEQITSEEMESLNSAIDILSKYAVRGQVSQSDIDYFERLVQAIIDGDESVQESKDSSKALPFEAPLMYPTTKHRLEESIFERDLAAEKKFGINNINLYGYFSDSNSLYIIGEIHGRKPQKEFCMICTLYDKDGDIIETVENDSYGSGLVTSMIKPAAYFNGFPFKFTFWGTSKKKVKKILIYPAESY